MPPYILTGASKLFPAAGSQVSKNKSVLFENYGVDLKCAFKLLV